MDLSAYTVLEVGEYVATPYAGKLLSDVGADVLKVEPPEGDVGRHVGPFEDGVPDVDASGFFGYLNTGKRSITLDPESDEAPDILRDLIEEEDVDLVLSADLSDFGVDPEALADEVDGLVVISLSGFGATGPWQEYEAPDIVAWAESGQMNKTGYPDSPPTRAGLKSTDYWAGQSAALAAFSAILFRDLQGGSGQFVDVSKRDAGVSSMEYFISGYSWSGATTTRTGSGYPDQGPQPGFPTVFEAADGYFSTAVTTPGVWEVFCEHVLERPELVEDERFHTQDARQQNLDAVEELITDYTSQHDKWDLLEEFQTLGIPSAVTTTPEEVVEFEHLKARNFWQDVPLPNGHEVTMPGFQLRFDDEQPAMERAPALGEHNTEVYGALGFDLERLSSAEVI